MRDYGKVHHGFWTSLTIRSLSEDARMIALYLLTTSHGTIVGAFRMPNGYFLDDTGCGWATERVSQGFTELFAKGFANRCEQTGWVWIRKFLKWNPPENPNQRKAARKVLTQIPEGCSWKADFIRDCGTSLGMSKEEIAAMLQPFDNGSPTVPANPKSQTVSKPLANGPETNSSNSSNNSNSNSRERGPAGEAHNVPPEASPSAPTLQDAGSNSQSQPLLPAGDAHGKGQGRGQGELDGFDYRGLEVIDDLQQAIREAQTKTGSRLPADYVVPDAWITSARKARPDLPEAQIRDAGPVFVGYWSAKPGQAGLKLNWLSTWLNWIRKENAPSAAAQRQARLVEPSKFGSAEVRAKDAQVAAKYGATIVGRSRQ